MDIQQHCTSASAHFPVVLWGYNKVWLLWRQIVPRPSSRTDFSFTELMRAKGKRRETEGEGEKTAEEEELMQIEELG